MLTEREGSIRVIRGYDLAKKPINKLPKFTNDDAEAAGWASAGGRAFVKQQSARGISRQQKGSPLVANLGHTSVQIALRLPAPDVAKAREIAGRKGIGRQTLLKMLVHEGLRREARRQ